MLRSNMLGEVCTAPPGAKEHPLLAGAEARLGGAEWASSVWASGAGRRRPGAGRGATGRLPLLSSAD